MIATIAPSVGPGKLLRRSLWGAQIVVALVFCAAGAVKLLTPISQLSGMLPWGRPASAGPGENAWPDRSGWRAEHPLAVSHENQAGLGARAIHS
jgi:hypothetical protein